MKKKVIPIVACFVLILFIAAIPAGAKNIVKIGSDVVVETDQKVNNVINIGGQVTVNGLVDHNVIAIGGSVVLTNEAVVRGDVVCAGGVIVRGSNAQVFGDIMEINSTNISNAFSSAMRGELEGLTLFVNIISLCFFAVIFIIGLLVSVLIPRILITIARQIKNYQVKSFFWGFVITLMIVPFFMLLVISLIGITLIPLVFTLLLLAFILGYIATATLVGNFVFTRIFHRQERFLIRETITGLLLLLLIGWIPYVGWLFKFIALTVGLGGVFLALFNRKWRSMAPNPSAY